MANRENDMRQRSTDEDTVPDAMHEAHTSTVSHRIVREVPMWSVYSVLGMILVIAAGMYYGLQRQAELMTEVRADVRALTAASIVRDHETVEIKSDIRSLTMRMEDSVRRQQETERRVTDIERARRH